MRRQKAEWVRGRGRFGLRTRTKKEIVFRKLNSNNIMNRANSFVFVFKKEA